MLHEAARFPRPSAFSLRHVQRYVLCHVSPSAEISCWVSKCLPSFLPTVGRWLHNNGLLCDPLFHHRTTLAPFWILSFQKPLVHTKSVTHSVDFNAGNTLDVASSVAFACVTLYMGRVLCWFFLSDLWQCIFISWCCQCPHYIYLTLRHHEDGFGEFQVCLWWLFTL